NPDPLIAATQLALAAGARLPVLALHRVFEPIGAEDLPPLGPPARAAALLGEVGAVFVCVVGLLPDDHAILDQHFVDASSAAVVPACHGNPLPLGSGGG